MKPAITKWMIQQWIGSDHQNSDAYLGLLVEFANGIYTVDEFRADVIDYAIQEGEEV